MNLPRRILAQSAAVFFSLSALAPVSAFYLQSPDRPAVWYDNTWGKVSQELTWDASKHLLVLYVSYGEPVIRERDPLSYDTFHLSFPGIRLDRSTSELYFLDDKGRRICLGHLGSGFFGAKVTLNPGLTAIARRDRSVLSGALQSDPP